jgi:hypothetical protein
MGTHGLKIREKGKRAWYFVTSKGGSNRLRIHAARFDDAEKAQAVIDKYAAENDHLEFKVVDLTA